MGVGTVKINQRFQRFGRMTVQVVDTTMLQTHVEKPTEPPLPEFVINVFGRYQRQLCSRCSHFYVDKIVALTPPVEAA